MHEGRKGADELALPPSRSVLNYELPFGDCRINIYSREQAGEPGLACSKSSLVPGSHCSDVIQKTSCVQIRTRVSAIFALRMPRVNEFTEKFGRGIRKRDIVVSPVYNLSFERGVRHRL